jgi:hypothetical protein
MDHVTAEFEVPLTVGVNVAVLPPVSVALPGERLILTVGGGAAGLETGCKITGVLATSLGSAALIADTVTVCCALRLAGAV